MGKRNPAQTKRLLARNIRRLRKEKAWSQHDLANEAGLRQALVSALELGDANPTLESLDKIATALAVSLADLLSPAGI
jgi:transcriptional regulator with XRE-family HTH domain